MPYCIKASVYSFCMLSFVHVVNYDKCLDLIFQRIVGTILLCVVSCIYLSGWLELMLSLSFYYFLFLSN